MSARQSVFRRQHLKCTIRHQDTELVHFKWANKGEALLSGGSRQTSLIYSHHKYEGGEAAFLL